MKIARLTVLLALGVSGCSTWTQDQGQWSALTPTRDAASNPERPAATPVEALAPATDGPQPVYSDAPGRPVIYLAPDPGQATAWPAMPAALPPPPPTASAVALPLPPLPPIPPRAAMPPMDAPPPAPQARDTGYLAERNPITVAPPMASTLSTSLDDGGAEAPSKPFWKRWSWPWSSSSSTPDLAQTDPSSGPAITTIPAPFPTMPAPARLSDTPIYRHSDSRLEIQDSSTTPLAYPAPGAARSAWPPAPRAAGSDSALSGPGSSDATTPLSLGPGDVLALSVVGRPELASTVYVAEDGTISVPLAGTVHVAGQTPSEAAAKIGAAYVAGDYLKNPQVNVVLSEFRSQKISVLGEVHSPGRFPVETRINVLDALAQAGGVTEIGADTVYILRKQGSQVQRFKVDVSSLMDSGSGQPYFELHPGDTVMVPKAEQFYIYGEVRTPNAYRLKPGTTVIQALSLGGGLNERGSDRRVEIKRRMPDGHLQTFDAHLGDVLQADDVIYVKERFF